MTSLIVLCGYSIIQFFLIQKGTIDFVGNSEYRLEGGILAQGNGLSMTLERVFPYILILFFNYSKYKLMNKKILYILFFTYSATLFLTLSRGGWIAFIIASILVLLFNRKKLWAVLFTVLSISAVYVIEPIRTRLFTDLSTVSFRSVLWKMLEYIPRS